jgi:hypothetical protein
MSVHIWTIPDEMYLFMNRQFVRFNAPYPPEKVINEVGEFVMAYVAEQDYFPRVPSEAAERFNDPSGGLNSAEKLALMGPLEYRIKVQLFINIDFNQLHLACWAALLWCWSEEGELYVRFHKESQAAAKSLYDGRYEADLYQSAVP